MTASAIATLIATGIVFQRPRRTTFDSVAVLPILNSTGDADNDYLSDGITDRLINGLAQVSSLRVVPRSLVYRTGTRASTRWSSDSSWTWPPW